MGKRNDYQDLLQTMEEWDQFLLQESGLPGPRGNIELAQAVAEEGNLELFNRYLQNNPEKAPTNHPGEFLAFCGVLGLGRLLAEGQREHLPTIRFFASDIRWRLREAVAMALQRWGDVDFPSLLSEMKTWAEGSLLEKRAAVAALCEPRLLKKHEDVGEVLLSLDEVTRSIHQETNRRSDDFIALRKGLAYCWSVAVVANPKNGKQHLEKWILDSDKDIRWIMRENLKKNRLIKMDPKWVQACMENLDKKTIQGR